MKATTPQEHVQAPILPGSPLGVLGSGQLGRMFAIAAAELGYHVHVFSPRADSPTGQVAHRETVAEYDDLAALEAFARSVSVVTLEFENIPTVAVETIQKFVPVRPSLDVLHISQHRLREKQFLTNAGIACAPFAEVNSREQLVSAIETIGLPAVLKTIHAGYDGKGQMLIRNSDDATTAWNFVGQRPAALEGWIEYQQELSVLVARSVSGEMTTCGPIANDHVNHILDLSYFPAPALAKVADAAESIAKKVAERLSLVGIACVEMFLTNEGQLLVNEIAPRPHNSGHLTIEACATSQFEQQVRAVCGLPLGSMQARSPAAMANLLGDLWSAGVPNWHSVLLVPQAHLHLYGKAEAKKGRKMGHLTVLAEQSQTASEAALALRAGL
ncbi:5-(carboxyamino)imidazole ribonucleotide synthase [Bythopirellula polymerisocia]|uniref:N5-carboxyaminoimidazole ribonucleotide synthase n=1 Tax=Bythopirellula polymerisocia TaxID=2528003 RepID=A0A5C6D1A9_9BACT|nr:5-(carboxyamino)imidazole ribonucleotide synthase [Bythopirellula polymerisocia]TWU29614.1 N5-carboxyaminoimidazole ribonucleotide synthase [Bythopirellula polymerisocia]